MGTLRVAHDPAGVGTARRRTLTALASCGLPTPLLDDVALVVSELVGNAVRHGAPVPDGGVLVSWELDGSRLRIEVCDGGGGPRGLLEDEGPRPEAPLSAEGGRGLAIVATIAVRWGRSVRDGLTCVEAELEVPAAGERYATG